MSMPTRTLEEYPYLRAAVRPGFCRHAVQRPGMFVSEACYRRAEVEVAPGVGLCRAHHDQLRFWLRGGVVGTPGELFDHLAAAGRATSSVTDRETGETTVLEVRAPRGWAITAPHGHVSYTTLARHVGRDGEWRWWLANPTGGRRRQMRRAIPAAARLILDEEGGRE